MLTIPRYTWTAPAWRRCPSIDTHCRAVLRRWPGAMAEYVVRGVVHRVGNRVVAECRDLNGRQAYRDWIAEPDPETRP